jgi:lysozyme
VTVPAELVEHIAGREGFRPVVYDDATGRALHAGDTLIGTATIGCGTVYVTREQAHELIRSTLAQRETGLAGRVWFDRLNAVRQGVLLEVAYNLGLNGLLGFRRMIAALTRQDFVAAARELMDSNAARALPGRYSWLAARLQSGHSK